MSTPVSFPGFQLPPQFSGMTAMDALGPLMERLNPLLDAYTQAAQLAPAQMADAYSRKRDSQILDERRKRQEYETSRGLASQARSKAARDENEARTNAFMAQNTRLPAAANLAQALDTISPGQAAAPNSWRRNFPASYAMSLL